MSKPLGYWGCSYDNPLVCSIVEHYGDYLENMSEVDQSWLLGRLGQHYWMKWCNSSPTAEAEEVRDRLEELPKNQLGWLIQAVGNKGTKPLGYYSLDYDIPLIRDIAETYNDSLRSMSEVDQAWLIGMMGDFYFQHHIGEDVSESDTAGVIYYKFIQLDRMNCGALIQALANK